LVELIGVKNEAKTIRLTRFFKETREVILDTSSALTMGGRFKNTTPVTESAFSAILSRYFRQHDVFDAIIYKKRQKPSKRQLICNPLECRQGVIHK
jgi:hypothetical protein